MPNLWDKLEDKWYAFLDSLDSRGIPVYKIIDPIEASGIPSFPLFVGIAILIVLGIAYVGMGGGPGGGVTLTLTVKANGNPVEGASVIASYEGEVAGKFTTDENGIVKIRIPKAGDINLQISKEGCEKLTKMLTVSGDMETTLTLQCGGMGGCLELPSTLKAVRIKGEGSQEVYGCKVYAVHSDGLTDRLAWTVSDGQLFVSDECIAEDDMIRIECDGFSDDFLPEEIFNAMKTEDTLYLTATDLYHAADIDGNGIPDFDDQSDLANDLGFGLWDIIDDDDNGVPDTYEMEETTKMTIIVKDEKSGKLLDGINVKAVYPSGDEIEGAAGTTSGGVVTLTVPLTKIKIVAEDPMGEYSTYTSPPFDPVPKTTVKMSKGLKTKIVVTDPDGRGIGSVTVLINKEIRLRTNIRGIAEVTLPSGNFDVYAFKDGYTPGYISITSGETASISLEKLTRDKSGGLTVNVINPEKGGDPFPRVKIRIETDGLIAGECTTKTTGKCIFKSLKPGKYSIFAMPPSGVEFEEVEEADVEIGRMNVITAVVYPATLTIRVRTIIDGKPGDADVTLYRTYPDIEEVETQTTEDSYAQFDGYYGISYYVIAKSDGGYTGVLGPFKLERNIDKVIYLEKPEENIRFEITPFLEKGTVKTGKLVIGLPYENKEMKTKFDEITAYIWIGDEGEKTDPNDTPVLINRIQTPDMQRPRIGIFGYDRVENGELRNSNNPTTQTSKGLKITITDYDVGSIGLDIPLIVRKAAMADTVKIHYKVDYGDIEGEWKTIEISLSGGENLTGIPEGDFYAFSAGLATSPDGEPENSIIVTKDSVFYLLIEARVREATSNPSIPIEIVPNEAASIEAYSGTIISGGNTYEIARKETSSISNLLENTLLEGKGLNPEDIVYLTVEMLAEENGTINVMPFSDDGASLVLTAESVPADWEATPIANVEGALVPKVRIETPSGYTGYTNWKVFNDDLPIFSLVAARGRQFRIDLTLKNNGADQKKVRIDVESTNDGGKSIDFNYPSSVSIRGGCHNGCTRAVSIEGVGVPGTGEIKIYVWQDGTSKPDTPWKTISYEPNDFTIDFETYGEVEGQNKTFTSINEFTSDGIVWVSDSYGDVYLPSGIVSSLSNGNSWLTKSYDENGDEVRSFTGSFSPGENAVISVRSSVADLEKAFTVQGAAVSTDGVSIDSDYWIDEIGNATMQSNVGDEIIHNITITNYWDNDLTIDAKIYLDWINGGSGSYSFSRGDGYNFSVKIDTYNADRSLKEMGEDGYGSATIGPNETAIVHYITKITGNAATQVNHSNKLVIELDVSGEDVSKTLEYYQNVSANVSGSEMIVPSGGQITYAPGSYVVHRDPNPPWGPNLPTCIANVNDDKSLTYAEICDAEQLITVIESKLTSLEESEDVSVPGILVALGNEEFGTELMDAYGIDSDIINNLKIQDENGDETNLACGILNLSFYKIYNQSTWSYDYYIRVSKMNAPWCGAGNQSFFIGLLNINHDLESEAESNLYELNEDGDMYLSEAISGCSAEDNIDPSWFISYSEDWISSTESDIDTEKITTINWIFKKKSEVETSETNVNAPWSWVAGNMSENGWDVSGFVKWDESTKTYSFGVVYDDSLDLDTAKDLAKCFMSNLVGHWSTGDTSFIDESNVEKGIAIGLDDCKCEGISFSVPEYDFDIIDAYMNKHTDGIVNTDQLYVNTSSDISYCYIWDYEDGTATPSYANNNYKEDLEKGVEIDETGTGFSLYEGVNQIAMLCYAPTMIVGGTALDLPGKIIVHNITVDMTGPSMIGGTIKPITVSSSTELGKYNATIWFDLSDTYAGVKGDTDGPGPGGPCALYLIGDNDIKRGEVGILLSQTVQNLTGGSVRVNLTIGFNHAFTGSDLISADLENALIPGSNMIGIYCNDSVDNQEKIGEFEFKTVGGNIIVEPELYVECEGGDCPITVSDFTPVEYNNKYYVNTTSGVFTFYAYVESLAPIQSCYLNITDPSGTTIASYITCTLVEGNENVGVYQCVFDPSYFRISQLSEGEYNAKITCIQEEV